jgi:phage gp36-like protein
VTLDETDNWKHAEMLDRGTVPVLPERLAAERVGSILRQYVDAPLTDAFWTQVGGKVVANFAAIAAVHAELVADPARMRDRGEVLKQQASNEVESDVWWEEHVHHLRREYEDALRILERVKAGTLSQLVDRDDRAAQEDTDRISQERAAEKASAGAPRLGGAA